MSPTDLISIIIPTLNESENIACVLESIQNNAFDMGGIEIIVIDADSTDDTLIKARKHDVRIESFSEFKGQKFKSLNYGASQANGEILMFLDADCQVPVHFDQEIRMKLSDNRTVGGAFEYQSQNREFQYKIIEMINRLRYRVDGLYFGDQGIFCRKMVFEEVEGYPEEPLMEASFLCKKLREIGKLSLIKSPIITSTRRFERGGKWSVFYKDFIIWLRFLLGLEIASYAPDYWAYNQQK